MRYFFFILLIGFGSTVLSSAFAETYYAKIENNIVTNVIVADQKFIDTQPGTWVQTFQNVPGKHYAGIGHYWNDTKKDAIPIRNPDDVISKMKTNFTAFLNLVSVNLFIYNHPSVANATAVPNGTITESGGK